MNKGEWKLREIKEGDEGNFIHHTDEYQIMNENGIECIATMGTGWAIGKAKANAQLIASAPDLYEALKGITEYMIELRRATNQTEHWPILERMEQALAKAEGK